MLRIERWASGLEIVLGLLVAAVAALALSTGGKIWLAAGLPLDIEPIRSPGPKASVPLNGDAMLAAFTSGDDAAHWRLRPEGLRLWGVAMVDGVGVAVLETTGDGTQGLYRPGDSLGDATLVDVDWERVTLELDGERFTVPLEVERSSGEAAPEPTVEPTLPTAEIRQTGRDSYIVDRGHLVDGVGNMSSLLTQLRAVPEVEQGEPIGFRVFSIRDDSIFRELGLRDGDVVRRVNGATLRDPAALLSFLQSLGDEPRVALDLVRAGEAHTLVYDLR